ncbi:MAG: GTP cyclohydrolase I FolE [Candidatus Latescibacterota bacterium]|nr:MAG: GTP cyclohydrolase I FolE [Candidatus Latescibacterota bacterium]RKY72878.1 MAG: GTP cyclohydrolase I FolE [Candidatus Latescibacterota bacterium]HDH99512.1 GTP cyclohydrolase I FolE [Bacillota bacterium]
MDLEKIEQGVRLILEGIGDDPDREGLVDTPRRVAQMYRELFCGLEADPIETLKVYITENRDEMILVKDIPFYSMCEHHLLPFFGKVHIAYIPDGNRVTGFSHLVRVVENFARRPQLQERMTTEIAETIMRVLKPKGVLVVVEAEQMCLTMRGVQKPGSKTLTSAMRGIMRQEATRLEAFSMIMGGRR